MIEFSVCEKPPEENCSSYLVEKWPDGGRKQWLKRGKESVPGKGRRNSSQERDDLVTFNFSGREGRMSWIPGPPNARWVLFTTKPERSVTLVGEISQEPTYGRLERLTNSCDHGDTIDLDLSGMLKASLQRPKIQGHVQGSQHSLSGSPAGMAQDVH